MNRFAVRCWTRSFVLLGMLAGLMALPSARAGLTLSMELNHESYQGNRYFYFWPGLNTNANPPSVPFGTYFIAGPGYPTNGSTAIYTFDTNGFNLSGGGAAGYNDFDDADFSASLLQNLTNGIWSLFVTNTVTTNVYHFGVNTSVRGTDLPDVSVLYPAYGATGIERQPTIVWQGPTNYEDVVVYLPNDSIQLPPTQTNWQSSQMLNLGPNSVTVHYDKYPTGVLVASTPTNSLGQSLTSWVVACHLEDYFTSDFTVGTVDTSGTAHSLVAHYPFEDTGGTVLDAAIDTSGHGFDMSVGGGYGPLGGSSLSSDAAADAGAVQLNNGDGGSGGYFGWNDPTPAELLSTLAGSFSISCWIKTSQWFGNDNDPAYYGAGLVSADVGGLANDTIPLALTGSRIGFNTGGSDQDDTVNSVATVNDGNYHHVVVTRNQATGQKVIYIDGVLDSFGLGTTNLLNDPQKLTIGSLADAGNSDPNDGSYYNGYDGLLDDLQIYSGVLSSNDVANLYANPGSTIPDAVNQDFNAALNTSALPWSTSGDSSWFVETTNTQDTVSAAQSGSVTDFQSSSLSVTVTGPGTLTFYWSSFAEDPNNGFDFEFDIDGNYMNDIWGDTAWYQDGSYSIGPGTHTLSWTAYANGDSSPEEAGFLDQVSFVTVAAPVITQDPFSQTNAPGYSVALLAAASGTPPITWQWFKVGNPTPIANATNALFIPANAGTPAVAGNYYATASNSGGSANSAVATVSFVNTPLPTDWARAFKSPADNNNTLTEEYYLASVPDSAGNLYAAGSFTGTNTFGAKTFISTGGNYETEIVKQTATGALLWAVAMTNNGAAHSQPQSATAAPGDGLYVAGNFSGTNWLGTNKLAEVGGGGVFLARLDANGNTLWVRTVTSASNFVFTGFNMVAADPAGNVTVSLLAWGQTTFSSTDLASSTNLFADGQIGAMAHFDANGKLLWAGLPGGWVVNMAYGAGRLYGSMFSPTAGFAGITNVTDRNFSIAAMDPNTGHALWLRGVGAPQGVGNPFGILLDIPLISVSGPDLTIVGVAYGSNAAFGPYTLSWNGGAGQYFARYDTNGNVQLATSFGSPTTQTYATAPDGHGNIYVAGDFDTYSYFGTDLLAAPHKDTIGNGYFSHSYVAKFDRNGHPLWARPMLAQNNYVLCRALAVVPDGVWGCVTCKSPAAFGTNLVSSAITCIGSPSCTLEYHNSGAFGKIAENAPALPVTVLNPHALGLNYQLSFLSQSGYSHAVQYRTNLVSGSNWQTYSTVTGDGSLKTIGVPFSIFSPSPQGFIRVSTQ